MTINPWAGYYKDKKNAPPAKLLLQALPSVNNKKTALDIGAGSLIDSKYLLEQGFEVTAFDNSPPFADLAAAITNPKFQYQVCDFNDFEYQPNHYDLASAMYSLPFCNPAYFNEVFSKIKNSLTKDGIFCGQFFGINDEWNGHKNLIFHTKNQVLELLSDLEIVYLDEFEKDRNLANGTPKHWHAFDIIARKI